LTICVHGVHRDLFTFTLHHFSSGKDLLLLHSVDKVESPSLDMTAVANHLITYVFVNI